MKKYLLTIVFATSLFVTEGSLASVGGQAQCPILTNVTIRQIVRESGWGNWVVKDSASRNTLKNLSNYIIARGITSDDGRVLNREGMYQMIGGKPTCVYQMVVHEHPSRSVWNAKLIRK